MNRDDLRLVPHDPSWKEDFLTEKLRIENSLNDRGVRIEHVGSTAIPTVHAKPILGIAIVCGDLEAVITALTDLGYEYRGQFDDRLGHFYAVLDKGNIRLCQAHIYTEHNYDWKMKLLFRDVLSQDPELAREYDEYKLGLARTSGDKHEYAENKTRWLDTFIQEVVRMGL